MKRNNLFYIMIPTLIIFLIQSCTENQENLLKKETSSVPYEFFENEVKKELVLTDESGDNTVFLAIYSDNINRLESFINSYDLKLITLVDERSSIIFNSKNQVSDNVEKHLANNDLEQEPKIYIEVVYENLTEGINRYFIDLKSKVNKKAFVFGMPIGFITSNDFIGTVHLGWGSEYLVQFRYKDHWYSGWETLWIGGVNSWWVWPSSSYWASFSRSTWKLELVLYPDLFQTETNYRVVYQSNARPFLFIRRL